MNISIWKRKKKKERKKRDNCFSFSYSIPHPFIYSFRFTSKEIKIKEFIWVKGLYMQELRYSVLLLLFKIFQSLNMCVEFGEEWCKKDLSSENWLQMCFCTLYENFKLWSWKCITIIKLFPIFSKYLSLEVNARVLWVYSRIIIIRVLRICGNEPRHYVCVCVFKAPN